ncbi:hypothetical protein [Nitrobacter winogradskyi]|uniref:Uncharacterized protein n=1 Tax=Nitrobacter winogradskyi TaxID=913 RepID=A0ACC6AMI0_NITWI|nr:hypothetical protein [Nitrobacter winogradskyi]
MGDFLEDSVGKFRRNILSINENGETWQPLSWFGFHPAPLIKLRNPPILPRYR